MQKNLCWITMSTKDTYIRLCSFIWPIFWVPLWFFSVSILVNAHRGTWTSYLQIGSGWRISFFAGNSSTSWLSLLKTLDLAVFSGKVPFRRRVIFASANWRFHMHRHACMHRRLSYSFRDFWWLCCQCSELGFMKPYLAVTRLASQLWRCAHASTLKSTV